MIQYIKKRNKVQKSTRNSFDLHRLLKFSADSDNKMFTYSDDDDRINQLRVKKRKTKNFE